MKKENRFIEFFSERFRLERDKIAIHEIVDTIKKSIYFRGTNLWILIFAIMIASLGLNMNSTAVIIGAMLISPLMGPIMGIGLGIGIYDFVLIKKSLLNFTIAIVISLLTSTVYFLLSPLNQAHSELLARTTPTVYDVFIAFFGGLAGIVAGASKERGNVIPGVAIATALMPPLCTAGYGLAVGNLYYFLGAFYLFFINSVFILFATYLIVRFLKFPVVHYPDPKTEKRMRLWIYIVVALTLIPSVFIAYRMIRKNIYENNVDHFVAMEMTFPGNILIDKKINFKNRTVDLGYVGKGVSSDVIENAKRKTKDYGLGNTTITISQGLNDTKSDISAMKSQIVEELYKKNEDVIKSKDDRIAMLEQELQKFNFYVIQEDVYHEAKALFPGIEEISVSRGMMRDFPKDESDTVVLAFIKFNRMPPRADEERIENWLKARLQAKKVKLIVQK